MGAGIQRWWRDDTARMREEARWILAAEPQMHFREFAKAAYAAFLMACADHSLFPTPPKLLVFDLSKTCRGCGRQDGTHERDCRVVAAEEKLLLQAACEHQSCGVMRTLGDPPGPWCCARCGAELSADQQEDTRE